MQKSAITIIAVLMLAGVVSGEAQTNEASIPDMAPRHTPIMVTRTYTPEEVAEIDKYMEKKSGSHLNRHWKKYVGGLLGGGAVYGVDRAFAANRTGWYENSDSDWHPGSKFYRGGTGNDRGQDTDLTLNVNIYNGDDSEEADDNNEINVTVIVNKIAGLAMRFAF